jgi:potassium-transporting ATPase KdpC subunit
MLRALFSTTIIFITLTIITGLIYPLSVTGIAQLMLPFQSNGSIIVKEGKQVGSILIGQYFADPKYFWGRPSATMPYPYNASSSSGTNMGPGNPALQREVKDRIVHLKSVDPDNGNDIPVDLVTTSGSGLDPHISLAAAAYQIRRIARIRKLKESSVRVLVETYTEQRQFGILGEPRVNVVRLNMALDEMK